ncbi:hypothetical protein LEP1GSC085_4544 [Leptospira interrogans str. L0996]|nr:hypothetical protein LEP1GSC085_4544 [Leptospira interrogans str. L0996]
MYIILDLSFFKEIVFSDFIFQKSPKLEKNLNLFSFFTEKIRCVFENSFQNLYKSLSQNLFTGHSK